jgi:hypothetical protein
MKINFFSKSKNAVTVKKGNINPNIYWMWIFSLGFFLTLVSCAFGFYLFTKVEKDQANPNAGRTPSGRIISKEKINKTLEYFSQRVQTSNNILNSSGGVVDPSL